MVNSALEELTHQVPCPLQIKFPLHDALFAELTESTTF